jgi:hypothetical protein
MRVPPALFFIFIFCGQPHPELASTRHFANAFSTLFHHASCLPYVPSRRHVYEGDYFLFAIAFVIVFNFLANVVEAKTCPGETLCPVFETLDLVIHAHLLH